METDEPTQRTQTNPVKRIGRSAEPIQRIGRQADPVLHVGNSADPVLHIGRSAKKMSRKFEESKKPAETSAENRLFNKELRQAFKKKRKDRKRLQKKADGLSDVLAKAMDFDKGGGENKSGGEIYNFQEHFR